ncbi:hypothetical protein A3L11_07180 [Thermococcus siculi]|uniref:Uncharacterized protein n=1 Tax=Thermococcus siculi TaxID=72803 RepID=A0A2Z2MNN3_9EURY|nr:hypothetical protein [Thermococcus siculi]ASJ09021.1 hypothetical protein A3L11_07180 [Thermococcus siculi]
MRRRNVYILLLAVLILSVVFYWGNFAFAVSKAASTAQVGTARESNATVNPGFCIYPDSKLGELVADELRNRGHRVLLLSAPVQCDGQFAALWVEWINVTYTPVFARGEIKVIAIYSSAGDPTHYLRYRNATDRRTALIDFEKTEVPQIRSYVILTVSDTSKGIMSLRGYADHLMEQSAKALADSLEKLGKEGAE